MTGSLKQVCDIESRGIDYLFRFYQKVDIIIYPYTLTEVDAIAEIANNNSIPITVYTGNSGRERYYQLHDDRSPQILHLATHAIFLEDVILDNHEFNDWSSLLQCISRSDVSFTFSFRWGLIEFEGKETSYRSNGWYINSAWCVYDIVPNTKLAVLSACNM